MKFRILFFTVLLCFAGLSLAAEPYVGVRYVHDGDTVVLATGETLRYLGIDAPEMGRKGEKDRFMALESRNLNAHLLRNARIRLEFDEERRDRYGRLLAYVFLDSGEMVNCLLIRKGLAFVLAAKPNMKYFSRLLDCQRQAMKERIGLWSRGPEKPEPFYMGNRNSYRFHRPDCSSGRRIARPNRVRFDTWEQAYWEGFSPCRRCQP